jgi:hypothetical protein
MKAALALSLLAVALLPSPAGADCICRAKGRIFHHGDVACLALPSGPQLARCGMVLNNSAWIKLQDGCPVTRLSPPAEPRLSAHLTAPGPALSPPAAPNLCS